MGRSPVPVTQELVNDGDKTTNPVKLPKSMIGTSMRYTNPRGRVGVTRPCCSIYVINIRPCGPQRGGRTHDSTRIRSWYLHRGCHQWSRFRSYSYPEFHLAVLKGRLDERTFFSTLLPDIRTRQWDWTGIHFYHGFDASINNDESPGQGHDVPGL